MNSVKNLLDRYFGDKSYSFNEWSKNINRETIAYVLEYIENHDPESGKSLNLKGFFSEYGFGIEKNILEAVKLYRMAIEKGNSLAKRNLLIMLNGIARDRTLTREEIFSILKFIDKHSETYFNEFNKKLFDMKTFGVSISDVFELYQYKINTQKESFLNFICHTQYQIGDPHLYKMIGDFVFDK